MITVKEYRLYCETEQLDKFILKYGEEEAPTKCPDDSGHIIASGSVVIVNKVSELQVDATIIEEEPGFITGGHYKSKNVLITASGGQEEHVSVSWPMGISLLSAQYYTSSGSTGDEVCVCVGKDTVVGVITATLSGGETNIPVNGTVLQYVKRGYNLNITDGVNVDNLGIAVNINDSSIDVELPVENSYSPTSLTTYVRMTRCLVEKGSPVLGNIRVPLGNTKVGSSPIPANANMSFHYKNNGEVTRSILVVLEYLF